MEFEWDPAKDAANLEKHGFGFADAVAVFADPDRLEEDSTRPEFGEVRGQAIGWSEFGIVTVVFTDRGGYRRIISARKAHRDERARYGQGKA